MIGGGGIQPGDEKVPSADSSGNVLSKEAVGNKADAAVAVVDTSTSLMAYVKGILNALAGGAVNEVVFPLGPVGNVLVQPDDSAVRYAVYLVNFGGNILTDGETVPGTFTVHRVRAGSDTEIISSTASTEATGVISAVVDFSAGGNWVDGDLGYIEFTGITATVGASTSELPVIRKSFRVSQEVGIESKIDTIDAFHDVPVADVNDNVVMSDVVGNKADGEVVTVDTVSSLMAYTKALVNDINAVAQRVVDGTLNAAAGASLGAGKSLVDALGADGSAAHTFGFDDGASVLGDLDGAHQTVHFLFIIPEAVGSINAHNAALLAAMQKLGSVHTITQADAPDFPNFPEYNVIVCGTDNGTVWTTSNLAHVLLFQGDVLCVDATTATFLQMGTDGGDAAAKTVANGIPEVKATVLGIGAHGFTGLAVGANTVADAGTTFNTLDMSDADVTETFHVFETSDANTDVLIGLLYKRQPDGGAGVGVDGVEISGNRYFYGCAFSFNALNALGQGVFSLLMELAVQSTTTGLSITLAGDIGDVKNEIFGNQSSEFNNGNPMVEYLTGRNSSGTRLAIGKSLYDVLGAAYVDAGGGLGTDNIAADLALVHNLVDSAETTGPFSYLDAGGEQDVVEDTAVTRRRITVNFDLTAMTLNGTVRLRMKVDGSTYVIYDETVFVVAGAEQAFDYQFTTNQAWKLTYEESADEGAARSVPFNVITEVIE